MFRGFFAARFAAATCLLGSVAVQAASRDIAIQSDFLYLPIVSRATVRKITMTVGDERFLSIPAEAADGTPQWWATINVASVKGKTLHLDIPDLPNGSMFLSGIDQGEAPIKDTDGLYQESLRPLVHFSAAHGWLNDPNGMLFFNGQYHLFFQLDAAGWGGHTKYWGHATSTDLVHWTEHPYALAPDDRGQIYSGGGVVDVNNTSGLGDGKTPPLVFFYTAAKKPFSQFMAYSTDGGNTLIKYANNPVIPNIHSDNRDPRPIWDEATKQWVLVVWVPLPLDKDHRKNVIQFLTSPDLKTWTPTSQSEGYFECPDLISFPGNKWVLTAASGTYQIGTFDGKAFHPETDRLLSVRHDTFYAAQTFSDLPKDSHRVIQMGWMRADTPGMSFNQCMSTPLELKIVQTDEGPRLSRSIAREMESLRGPAMALPGALKDELRPGTIDLGNASSDALDITLDLEMAHGKFTLSLRGQAITWNPDTGEFTIAGRKSPVALAAGRQQLRILLDRTTLEVFAKNGTLYLPVSILPPADRRDLTLQIEGTEAHLHDLKIYPLKSIWEK